MGATAEERVAKRRINELEEKLKILQRELRELKIEKKQTGNLRKQLLRASQTEADCKEMLEEMDARELEDLLKEEKKKSKSKRPEYKCKNTECISHDEYNNSVCDIIEVSNRRIIICHECGSRYTIVLS